MDEENNLKHFLPLWSFLWNIHLGATIPLIVPNPLGQDSGLQPFLAVAVGATPLKDVLGEKRKTMQLSEHNNPPLDKIAVWLELKDVKRLAKLFQNAQHLR